MSVLSEDVTRFTDFEKLGDAPSGYQPPFRLEILERSRHWGKRSSKVASVDALEQMDECDLMIILAPLDISLPHSKCEFQKLFEYLHIPSTFVSERLQSVRHSFGGRRDGHDLKATWFHFLCRRPNIDEYNRLLRFEPQGIDNIPKSLWDRFSLFMRVERTAQADSPNQNRVCITCFGASEDMQARLKKLWENEKWIDALAEPYILIDVVLDELYLLMDRNVQDVSEIFGNIENKVITSTASPGQAASEIDFRILHNIAKDVIYLEESFDSILNTAESITYYHQKLAPGKSRDLFVDIQDELEYRKNILISSRLQVRSLQKRVQNLIELSFHLVTQSESHIFQQDSFSMHAIALVGLLFLPLGSISSFLGTPFFAVKEPDTIVLEYGPMQIVWGVGGATLVLFFAWLMWYWHARKNLKNSR